jgi:hypothetical protein
VTLVFAPPRLLREQSEKSLTHLRDFSLPRLCDLYDDLELGASIPFGDVARELGVERVLQSSSRPTAPG